MLKSMRNIFVIFTIFAFSNLFAMEQNDAKTKLLNAVKPFSESPIRFVPQYVYENCNQGTRKQWSKEEFETLRRSVDDWNKRTFKIRYPNEKEYTINAELVDWIYGLKYLEETYVKTGNRLLSSLTLDELKKINGKFSRLLNDSPGEFRKRDIKWWMKDATIAEEILYNFFDYSNIQDLITGNNDFKFCWDPKTNEIEVKGIRRLLNYYKEYPQALVNAGKRQIDNFEIDLTEVDSWLREQNQKI